MFDPSNIYAALDRAVRSVFLISSAVFELSFDFCVLANLFFQYLGIDDLTVNEAFEHGPFALSEDRECLERFKQAGELALKKGNISPRPLYYLQ
jgi:hypothetical protein